MKLAGHTFDERDLRPRRGERSVMRWVLVRDIFAVGSTVAHELCREFNLDPDEVIK